MLEAQLKTVSRFYFFLYFTIFCIFVSLLNVNYIMLHNLESVKMNILLEIMMGENIFN